MEIKFSKTDIKFIMRIARAETNRMMMLSEKERNEILQHDTMEDIQN